MSFIRKSTPPPDVKDGEVLEAEIVDIVYPVESKYTDEKGNNRQQIKFELVLENGYSTKAWMNYYENPVEKSDLGTLSLNFMKLVSKQFDSVKQILEAIKDQKHILAQCTGFRDYQGQQYPKFKIVTDKFPLVQQSIQETTQKLGQAGSQINLNSLSPELRKKVEAELKHAEPE